MQLILKLLKELFTIVQTFYTKSEVDAKLADIPSVDAYTKAETDSLLESKADNSTLANYATGGELNTEATAREAADTALGNRVTAAETALGTKANSSTVSALTTRVAANESALAGHSIVSLTQAEYDSLTDKDLMTLYLIVSN